MELIEISLNYLHLATHMRIMGAYMHKFYKRVHTKLIELDRKRSWLLSQTDIKPSTWSSWEKHGRMPPADRAVAIAEALGLTVEFLVTGRETPLDMRGSDPLIAQISAQLLDMSEAQLRRIQSAVNTVSIEDGTA